MVTLTNLDKVLYSFEGEALKDAQGKELTYRKVLVTQLGSYNSQKNPGDNIIKAYDLGLKIHNTKDSIELDTDQYNFIETLIKENPMYLAVVLGQALKFLDSCKQESKMKEDKAKESGKDTKSSSVD